MYEDIRQFAGKALEYVSDKGNKSLEVACATTQYYGRQAKKNAKQYLEKIGYDEQKATELYMTFQDKVRRGKAIYIYPYLNPKTVSTTVDELARKLLLVPHSNSERLHRDMTTTVKYFVPETENVKNVERAVQKEIRIVFMYRLDIMKLLEIIALDKIQREEEDRIKRWNTRVKETKAYMDTVSKVVNESAGGNANTDSSPHCSYRAHDQETMTCENRETESDGLHAHYPPNCSGCEFKRERECACSCFMPQQNLRSVRKPCQSGHKTVSRRLRHQRQTAKKTYPEIRRNLTSRLLEELENVINEAADEPEEPVPDDDQSYNVREREKALDENVNDSGALVIQVPRNVNKIVLEKNGQKITIEV